ncbi:MAG: hypothetical protein ACI8Z7_000163 [Candidatus Nanohaloarchaea archaeon]|jgi:hypothetical protein
MTQKFRLSTSKGQSAIEYLMTYGWMLLVVAIVGGAIFATVQDSQQSCEQQINDIESTQQAFGVSDFSATNESLNVQLENNQQEDINVTSVTVGTYEADETASGAVTLGFGDSAQFTIGEITHSEEGCNTFDISVEYDEGGLDSEDSGSLQGQMADSS